MAVKLNNPLELLSLKMLGFGIKATYETTDAARKLCVEASFAFGKWRREWKI